MCQCQVLRASRLVFELSSEPSESDLLQHVLVSLFHWVGKGGKEGVEENQEKGGQSCSFHEVPFGKVIFDSADEVPPFRTTARQDRRRTR